MKLCTFQVTTQLGRFERIGALEGDSIVDLTSAACFLLQDPELARTYIPPDMRRFLERGEMRLAKEAVAAVIESGEARGANNEWLRFPLESDTLLAPLQPASLRDFYVFEQHVKAGFAKRNEPMPQEWYEMPVYYKSGHHNIIGTNADVLWPAFTERFDYELEWAAVIGRRGTNVKADAATNYIAGYTILNDFSARDIQQREMKVRLGPAKGKDWCSALGPVIVTPDEIGDPYALTMMARVNGVEWSRGSTKSMQYTFEQMIEFLTWDDTIVPGDVLGSGTVGTGCGLELDRWVQPGDTIELEVERIGVLRNRVMKAAEVASASAE